MRRLRTLLSLGLFSHPEASVCRYAPSKVTITLDGQPINPSATTLPKELLLTGTDPATGPGTFVIGLYATDPDGKAHLVDTIESSEWPECGRPSCNVQTPCPNHVNHPDAVKLRSWRATRGKRA